MPSPLLTTVPCAPWVTPVTDRRALEAVVGQHVGGDRRVLVGRGAVVDDVGHRIDRHVDRRRLGHAARGHRVGVAVGAVEVGVRRVGDRAVAIVDDRAVRALGDAASPTGEPSKLSLASTLRGDRRVLVGRRACRPRCPPPRSTVTLTVAVSVTPPESPCRCSCRCRCSRRSACR